LIDKITGYAVIFKVTSKSTDNKPNPTKASESPLVKGMALILERDAKAGIVPIRRDGSTVSDLREVREAQTP